MQNKDSLMDTSSKKGKGSIVAAQNTVKSQTSANSGDLSGKILLLPSGRTVAVMETTGRGTWYCMYDAPPMSSTEMLNSNKQQMYDSRKIELTTEFLVKYGQEIKWNQN